MKQGCKYCQYNKYDGIHLASNICSVDATHIDPYAEGFCDDFKPKDDGIIRDCEDKSRCRTCKYQYANDTFRNGQCICVHHQSEFFGIHLFPNSPMGCPQYHKEIKEKDDGIIRDCGEENE